MRHDSQTTPLLLHQARAHKGLHVRASFSLALLVWTLKGAQLLELNIIPHFVVNMQFTSFFFF